MDNNSLGSGMGLGEINFNNLAHRKGNLHEKKAAFTNTSRN